MNIPHPKRQLPPLDALRVFEAAARHLSFRRAAEELALTPTAISHRIRSLEERLGLVLFERHPRQVRLTQAGERLLPVIGGALDDMAKALDDLRPGRSRRVVTVSATRSFTARWLVPRLSGFAQAVPEADLHLHASDTPADLRQGVVDLAIRYGGGRYPGLLAQPLLPAWFVPVCAAELHPATVARVAATPLLAYDWRLRGDDTPDWPRWFREAGLTMPSNLRLARFTDEAHAIQAALDGQGIALVNRALVVEELARGALVTAPGPVLRGFDLHLVQLSGRDADAVFTRVRLWLQAEAAEFLRRHPLDAPTQRRGRHPRKLRA